MKKQMGENMYYIKKKANENAMKNRDICEGKMLFGMYYFV